jgi:hypothetical protein
MWREPLEKLIVGVAVRPLLAGLERRNNRMPRDARVGCRVAVRRIVATDNMTAGQTDAQMNPRITPLLALLATDGAGRHDPRVS